MSDFVPQTFWIREGMNLWHAARSAEQERFLSLLEQDRVCMAFVSLPVWTLERDFSLEELCLYKENGETSVSFSNGPRHGSWRLTRRVPWRRTSTTVLDVRYQRGDNALLGTLRERRFELVWGTSTFVKRPDAPGDPNDWSQFLIPLIDQTQHYEIPPLVRHIVSPSSASESSWTNLAGASSETRTAVEQDRDEPTPSRNSGFDEPTLSGNSGFEVAESAIDTVSYPMEEEDAETPAK